MSSIIRTILNWSEVWALSIPLTIMLLTKNKSTYLRPIRIFLILAFLTNCFIVVLAEYKRPLGVTQDDLLWNNNFLYNILSVFRLFFFSWFFIALNQRFMHRIKRIIPAGFFLFLLINFIFYEDFIPKGNNESFSSRLLATESALLLFYCLQYYIFLILEDKTTNIKRQRGVWVVTGLSIYVAASFFIYLFYSYLTDVKRNFAVNIWDVHNICFIILCIFIAIELYHQHKSRTQ